MDSSPPPNDNELDPSFMCADESDDEETIAQEELMEPEIDSQEELQILASDLQMSVEELTAQSSSERLRRSRKKVDYQAMLLEEERKKKENLNVADVHEAESLIDLAENVAGCSTITENQASTNEAESDEAEAANSGTELAVLYMASSFSHEDDENDVDFRPVLRPIFNRRVRVGPSYQAEVPEAPLATVEGDVHAEESEDLVWRPSSQLTEEELDSYLGRIREIVNQGNANATGDRTQPENNNLALETLLSCNYDQDLALQVFRERYLGSRTDDSIQDVQMDESVREVASDSGPSPPKKPRRDDEDGGVS